MIWRNLLLLAGVIVLAAVPLVMYSQGEFPGADDRAGQAVEEVNPNYKPWFSPIWEPPSGAVESMLFALQAAIGAGLVFYCIGYYRGRYVQRKREKTDASG